MADRLKTLLSLISPCKQFADVGCDHGYMAKAVLDGGNVMYHIRHGLHYLSREDWGEYMNYIDAQRKNNK